MAAVANRMANLDFDAKVTVTQDDELGELGYSMNQLSEKLESTIADLKSANLELKKDIEKKELLFIGLSGIAAGASWLCYYRTLQEGPASIVVPIDKLSIIVTIAFS